MTTIRVFLDESALIQDDEHGNPRLRSDGERLLRRLRYSKLPGVICHRGDVAADKADLIEETARLCSFTCISLLELAAERSTSGDICLYVTSQIDENLCCKLHQNAWRLVVIGDADGMHKTKDLICISHIHELFSIICRIFKKDICRSSTLVVGYVMKPSREEALAKRGAFPLHPTENGLIFTPISFELPLASQLEDMDIILHKLTDEVVSIDLRHSAGFPKGITFTTDFLEMARILEGRPDLCIIDQFQNVYPLLHRVQIQGLLDGIEDIGNSNTRVRTPSFFKVDDFGDSDILKYMLEEKLSFPLIVKPQVACGVDDAHNMAIVFKPEDFHGLPVPVPAVLQEYVDHSSVIFKFYVLGDRVFHFVKKSIPNAKLLMTSSPMIFNSLKSLPISADSGSMDHSKVEQSLDICLMNRAAKWLKERLGLTIFGFDIVIQEGSGDHVIVDVNYLPTFKEIRNDIVIPVFWDVIRRNYEENMSGR